MILYTWNLSQASYCLKTCLSIHVMKYMTFENHNYLPYHLLSDKKVIYTTCQIVKHDTCCNSHLLA